MVCQLISDRLPGSSSTVNTLVIFSHTWRKYLKSHDGRNVFNEARDTENHVSRMAVLLDYPIDLENIKHKWQNFPGN